MKVFISADMEGISGIPRAALTESDHPDYARGRELMAGDVNAAIEGALAAGATEIWVRDAHASACNLPIDHISPRAQVIQGWNGISRMMEGIDESFSAALLVGYHARALHESGTLSHTMTGQTRGLWYNGEPVGESGISAAHAGACGVPVVFASGDEALCAEVRQMLGPAVETAVVKSAFGRECVRLVALDEARAAIRQGVSRALGRLAYARPFVPGDPIEVRMQFQKPQQAFAASLVPTVCRVDDTTVAATVADGILAANLVPVLLRVAGP